VLDNPEKKKDGERRPESDRDFMTPEADIVGDPPLGS
jgi:hypothetical protein